MTGSAQPEALVRTESGAASHPGHVRSVNEDGYVASFPVFVVADGMGGHDAGELASAEVVLALEPLVGRPSVTPGDVMDSLSQAQRRVRAIPTPPGRDAGTTVAGVVVAGEGGTPYWLVVNLGDSRTYRMSAGTLEQVSVDHSEVQELVDAGTITPGQAAHHPRRHVVTRALGADAALEPDFWMLPVEENDRILVCSDGLTTEVDDELIARILLDHPHPQAAADALLHAALAAGGRDNVTVVVVDARTIPGDAATEATAAPGDAAPADDGDTVPRDRLRAVKEGLT